MMDDLYPLLELWKREDAGKILVQTLRTMSAFGLEY
jgi:hypothetical protein